MTTVILVKKGDQVQQKIECGVHKLICTDSLSPIPERQKKQQGGDRNYEFLYKCLTLKHLKKAKKLVKSLDEVN